MTSTLTSEQSVAAAGINAYLAAPPAPGSYFCLSGPPGSGKTFMLKEALQHERRKIVGATIAHSAKEVLRDSIPNSYTIAQLLGLQMDDSSEVITFRRLNPAAPKKIDEAEILIIDEASMIDDVLSDTIINEVTTRGIHLIVVGDPFQLPPVKQSHQSKFFDTVHAQLTTSKRFEGPIGELAFRVRQEIDNINNDKPFNKYLLDDEYLRENCVRGDTGFMFMNKIHGMVERAANDIVKHRDDKNYARILAYKNSTIQLLNEGVRSKIYGKHATQFERNEIVISRGGFSVDRIPILHNGQINVVTGIMHAIGPYDVPCVFLSLDGIPTTTGGIPVVMNTPDAMASYEKLRLRFYKDAVEFGQWSRYNKFLRSFAQFDYAYATSLYKAQGMTLNNVYVCEGEIMDVKPIEWRQRFQALYVAMTRARKELIIYNKNG